MPEHVVVSPSTGSLATMAIAGVSCVRPPKGMRTVAAPIVESKRSERPLLEATLRSVTSARNFSPTVEPGQVCSNSAGASTRTDCDLGAPLDARNSRLTSTIVAPRQCMRRRGSSVTVATGVASRFSSWA